MRLGLRKFQFQNFDFNAQQVTRARGPWPAKLIKASANYTPLNWQRLDQQAHGQRRRVPAAGSQATKKTACSSGFVKMEGLGMLVAANSLMAAALSASSVLALKRWPRLKSSR